MTFDEAMQAAAHAANDAVAATMKEYADGGVQDEPEITGALVGELNSAMRGQIGPLQWKSSILRNGRGVAGQEKRNGADLLIHVAVETPTEKYSKGVLIQAKRAEPREKIVAAEVKRLRDQCDVMLDRTSAAYVFAYARKSMRCGSATRFAAVPDGEIYRRCTWTPYRFFYELFRCPIGDRKITSRDPERLPEPRIIQLSATTDVRLDDVLDD